MSDAVFSMDMPDLQSLIKKLDMFDTKQNEALREALHRVGQNMQQAQKRRISSVKGGDKLSDAITVSKVYTTKNGTLGITSGYQETAFKTDSEGFNPGIVGAMREFGRPGKCSQRSKPKMKQTRKRIPERTDYKSWRGRKNWSKAVPTEVEIKKGVIQPTPHIRPGFDETLEQNVQLVADAVDKVIDRLGE